MKRLPDHEIRLFGPGEALPPEAEELFRRQLDDSRSAMAENRKASGSWRFALTCAISPDAHVLGGVYLDIGPIGGSGPLATERLAYLERTFIRPGYRRQGLATRLMRQAIEVARGAGCLYLRCSNNWDNEAERRLLLRCGFALIDLDGQTDEEPSYLAVRPAQ